MNFAWIGSGLEVEEEARGEGFGVEFGALVAARWDDLAQGGEACFGHAGFSKEGEDTPQRFGRDIEGVVFNFARGAEEEGGKALEGRLRGIVPAKDAKGLLNRFRGRNMGFRGVERGAVEESPDGVDPRDSIAAAVTAGGAVDAVEESPREAGFFIGGDPFEGSGEADVFAAAPRWVGEFWAAPPEQGRLARGGQTGGEPPPENEDLENDAARQLSAAKVAELFPQQVDHLWIARVAESGAKKKAREMKPRFQILRIRAGNVGWREKRVGEMAHGGQRPFMRRRVHGNGDPLEDFGGGGVAAPAPPAGGARERVLGAGEARRIHGTGDIRRLRRDSA